MKQNVLRISLLLLISGSVNIAYAQISPALSNVYFTDVANRDIDANGLQQNMPVRLNMTLFNFSPREEVLAGTFELRIDMGNIATLIPGTDLKKLPYTDYIVWTYEKGEKSNTVLEGKIIKPLPVNFVGKLQIDLKCVANGRSEIKSAVYNSGKIVSNSAAQAFFVVTGK